MDKMTIDKINEMVCREMDDIAEKDEMTVGDMESLHKLTGIKRNIGEIEAMEIGDYSQAGEWEARGGYGRTGYGRSYGYDRDDGYDRGNSYANRGMHYVRGHYSRAEAEDELMRKLREMSQDMQLPERYRKTAKDVLAEMK